MKPVAAMLSSTTTIDLYSYQYIDPSLLTRSTQHDADSLSPSDSIDYPRLSAENHQYKLGEPEQTTDESGSSFHCDSALPDISWSDQLAQSAVCPSPIEPTNNSYSGSPCQSQEAVTGQYNDSTLAHTLLGGTINLSPFETGPSTIFTDYRNDIDLNPNGFYSPLLFCSQPSFSMIQEYPTYRTSQSPSHTVDLLQQLITPAVTDSQNLQGEEYRLEEVTRAKEVLEAWYIQHRFHAYPSLDEKRELARLSGKSTKQVSTWFSNKRTRYKEAGISCSNGADRRLIEPYQSSFNPVNSTHVTNTDCSRSVSQARRKGKRRAVNVDSSTMVPSRLQSPGKSISRPWPCTSVSCTNSARNLYEWKRHEATHVPGSWTCMPEGNPVVNDTCVICGVVDPPVSHFRSHHNLDSCLAKASAEKEFSRKDKLNDHILRVHLRENSISAPKAPILARSALLEHWKREPASRQARWCGFCQEYCPNWPERLTHVGSHLQISVPKLLMSAVRRNWDF
ncbi:hypothetical protein E2P81_ATG01351 [Venturia nashicola]|uniref:Homeobox domain-containing protein n=1 Tax=Venturia nashicola TaxID=86259 RepID=A0A4Z1PDN6_9PEZI|nr:hypothetical protein E6O75_ATG01383 [Venturia nashicola]TLD38808.1 hypothetical protein E2P81_ATG01351 [Venturia nashicola]